MREQFLNLVHAVNSSQQSTQSQPLSSIRQFASDWRSRSKHLSDSMASRSNDHIDDIKIPFLATSAFRTLAKHIDFGYQIMSNICKHLNSSSETATIAQSIGSSQKQFAADGLQLTHESSPPSGGIMQLTQAASSSSPDTAPSAVQRAVNKKVLTRLYQVNSSGIQYVCQESIVI